MPIDEDEFHPYLEAGERIQAKRMIIGTFPTYSVTEPDTPRKSFLRETRGDIQFFYGSSANYFWTWYQNYVEPELNIANPDSILQSLTNRNIAISDVIKSCRRVDESFLDSELIKKNWNRNLSNLLSGSIQKVLCTSKGNIGAVGWLLHEILIPSGFVVSEDESILLHQHILNEIDNSSPDILRVAHVLRRGADSVRIVALPSPGSPYRGLLHFGKTTHPTRDYLNAYLQVAFNWFLE